MTVFPHRKYEGPRTARAGETSQLLGLLNKIFAQGCPAGMEREYPHLYRNMERNLDYSHVITFQGRIVSHVGVYPLRFVVRDRQVKAGGIGAVCTEERHRGEGLMSDLLGHCTEWMRLHEMPLSILWGDAVRYGRFGWRVAGTQVRIGLHGRSLPALARYRGRVVRATGTEKVIDELYGLHQKLRFRVARGRGEFGLVMEKIGRRIYAALAGKRIIAYCLVGVRGESSRRKRRVAYSIDEWAGAGPGILSILHSLLFSSPGSRVDMSLPAARLGWWTDLLKGADSWGLSVGPLGQIKVVEPDSVLKALGISGIFSLLPHTEPSRRRDLPSLLFGPLPPAALLPARTAHKIGTALPVPLFLFPSDHV